MKNKSLLFISLILSSSILHAELNPLSGAGDAVKDSVTSAVKEKVTDSAKEAVKEAVTPAAAPAAAAQGVEATNTGLPETAPATTEKPVKSVARKGHRKSSKKHH